ncbi:hypothetical protein [Labrys sp. KNU-23]|uniref:hypothetical protein n=1 Tax=Labrys sp. KNU-23 TaxID=2789216 RepID=UPI00165ABC60|nr:hypothetical protein [Labrys sp. KNU-23]
MPSFVILMENDGFFTAPVQAGLMSEGSAAATYPPVLAHVFADFFKSFSWDDLQ